MNRNRPSTAAWVVSNRYMDDKGTVCSETVLLTSAPKTPVVLYTRHNYKSIGLAHAEHDLGYPYRLSSLC